MAVIDADAHVVETERPWESMGYVPNPLMRRTAWGVGT